MKRIVIRPWTKVRYQVQKRCSSQNVQAHDNLYKRAWDSSYTTEVTKMITNLGG